MTPDRNDVVVVGASVSGTRVATELRRQGFAGTVTLLGDETCEPYDKPQLSKHLLGDVSGSVLDQLLTRDAAAELGLDLRLGRAATGLDTDAREVLLSDGTRVGYGVLVIATGCSAKAPPWPHVQGMQVLRSLADAHTLRDGLHRSPAAARRIAVIGAGFIGSEVASTARGLGVEVVLVDTQTHPLAARVGTVLADQLVSRYREHGVDVRFGDRVVAVSGGPEGVTVELGGSPRVRADSVVVGLGATPNTGWLEDSSVVLDDGVVADEFLRADGLDDVYAVGDLCRWRDHTTGESQRIEHWTHAMDQATYVAGRILDPAAERPFRSVPHVWSDQFGWKLTMVGRIGDPDGLEFVGDPATDQRFGALAVDGDGALRAAVSVNWPRFGVVGRKAIDEGLPRSALLSALGR